MRLEAVALVDGDEARIGEEDRLVAERLDGLRDADGIQRRPEGGFGEEGDRLSGHGLCSPNFASIDEDTRIGRLPADFNSIARRHAPLFRVLRRQSHEKGPVRKAGADAELQVEAVIDDGLDLAGYTVGEVGGGEEADALGANGGGRRHARRRPLRQAPHDAAAAGDLHAFCRQTASRQNS